MSSSSSNLFSSPRGMTPNLLCYSGDKMNGSVQRCNMFHFLDDELPNQYYKDLVYQLHLQGTRNGNENHISEHENTQNELLKIMEDLSMTKTKLKVYDRMMMCLVVVVMFLVVVAAFAA
ncbi:hypothetical protein OSB04_003773 [Centaurea solstitialis]|uniref:Uncharacterized protein n=1 Tax=Centaurea solstitialis TaxID=347529 RepID=A0AA38UCL1_9ASTR|nr:hypothetical protein OSB04_003773 [Centaurea solstitialis]